jgi:hypothetical protein
MPMLVLQEATPDWFSFAINAGRLIASCMLWLWWCDRHPRRVLALCATLTVWLMYPVLPSAALLPLLLPPDTTASSLWPILGTALLQNSKARFLALSVAIAMHFVLSLVGSAKKLPSAN